MRRREGKDGDGQPEEAGRGHPQGPPPMQPTTHVPTARDKYRRARGLQGVYQRTGSALQALRANLMRSLLTSLGIIFGVGAVIIVIAISEGNTASINARLSTLNPLQLTIRSGSTSAGGARGGAGTLQSLTQTDADALAQLP